MRSLCLLANLSIVLSNIRCSRKNCIKCEEIVKRKSVLICDRLLERKGCCENYQLKDTHSLWPVSKENRWSFRIFFLEVFKTKISIEKLIFGHFRDVYTDFLTDS